MSDELIPGPDPGACPDCGAWRKAGMLHSCVTDEIPQEVRAAVRRILGGYSERQDERWRGLVTWEQHDAKAVQILAAVLPLIEQRVSRDAYPQAWRYGAAEENARIVAALRAKGTHAADVLADQIEMEAP